MNKHKISSFFAVVLFVVLSICLLYVSRGLAQTKGAKPDQNSKGGQVSADAAQPGVVASATSPRIQAERSGVDVPTGTTCVPGTWATATTGPSARYRHGGVSDGTFIYVFGGGTSTGGLLNDLWRWDPATQTWTQLANMPTGKQNIQGAFWNGKIYVPGGFTTVHITENAIYDIATNTWSTGAPLPAAQTGTNVAFNNKIYNFGGNPGPQATVTIYDIASNTWSTGASMPVATTYGRSAVAGSFAYYIGGIAAATTNAVHRYDFAANTWTTVAPLQTARTSAEVMTSPDGLKLFAVMGGDSTFFTGVPLAVSVEIYNIAGNSWSYGNPVVNKAAASAGGLAGGKAMVQGGVDTTIYYDAVQVSPVSCGLAVTSTVPAVGSVVFSQPTDFVVNLSNPVQPATVQASDFTVNGTPANSFVLGGGNTQITFHFNSTPVIAQGLQTMHIAAGAFLRDPDGDPVAEFTGTFRYDATLLAVTTTVPAVGGVFTPPAPGSYQYDVNWNEAVDPASVSTTDLTLSGTSAANVTGVTVINANMTTRFTLNIPFGGTLTANIAAGAITDAFGNPCAAFSGNYTVQGCPPQDHYTIAQIGGSIVPGTTDIGNHADDLVTTIPLPFTYSLYGTNYANISVSSNGNAQFTTTDTAFTNVCPLPWTTHNATVFPYWDDQRTDAQTGCAGFPGGVCGIFTSISGTAPNRIFNIEWRTVYFAALATSANHELRLYEGQNRFDVIYGALANGNASATAGVQKDNTAFDSYFCNGAGGAATGGQSYILQSCANPLTANSAVSRQNHGAPGNFDVNLPLSGGPGVECRNGLGNYSVIITFSNNVVSGNASVTSGTGVAGAPSFSANTMTIPLSGVTDVQQITVTATNVTDVNAQVLPSVPVPMIMLIGDSAGTGNGSVGAADIGFVKSVSGQTTGAGNFRADIAINGTINAGDVGLVKSKSGNHVP